MGFVDGGSWFPRTAVGGPGSLGTNGDRGSEKSWPSGGRLESHYGPVPCPALCGQARWGTCIPRWPSSRRAEDQEIGPRETGPYEGKPLNLHRMKPFQRFAGWLDTVEMRLLVWENSGLGSRRAALRLTGRRRNIANHSRKPEILKPPPIGYFVESLLRAENSAPS